MTKAADPSWELPQLARSWIYPAAMSISGTDFTGGAYEPKERAYKVTKVGSGNFNCTLAGSSSNPIINPAIVIDDWGKSDAGLSINGVHYTGDYRVGHEGDNLVVWMAYEATSSTDITIAQGAVRDTHPPSPEPMMTCPHE
jgi:hypothetical protein